MSGEVVDVNAALEGEPALINGSAFDKGACILRNATDNLTQSTGWIAKIKLSNSSELASMMDEDGYKKHIDSL